MKNIISYAITILLTLSLLVGCSHEVELSDSSVDSFESSVELSAAESSVDSSEESVIEVFSSEESSEDTDEGVGLSVKYESFDDNELDYEDGWYVPVIGAPSLKIITDTPVKSFKFVEVFYDENDSPYVGETLYDASSFTKDDSFCVKTYIKKAYSNRGITYVNSKGEACSALIEYDSGHLQLTPFVDIARKNVSTTIKLKDSNGQSVQRNISFDGTVTDLFDKIDGFLPKQAKINAFYIANSVAHIDFNQAFLDAASTEKFLSENVASVLFSYYGDKGVSGVMITINNGKAVDFNGQIIFSSTADDKKFFTPLYLFDVYAVDFWLYPVSFDGTPEGLIAALVSSMDWNVDISVNSFSIVDRTAYIDLNKPFGDMVYSGLMAESGVTCVTRSIKLYYGEQIDHVSLTIEGAPFVSDYM